MKYILCSLSVFIVFQAFSQNRSFGTLPMVENPNHNSNGSVRSKVDSSKYLKALKVYNNLVNARGDFRYPVPTFSMSSGDEWVAYMDYNKMEIAIENKALQVCANFGAFEEPAIAFLLGHELTHYYEKHKWKKGFGSEFSGLKIGLKIDSLYDDVSNETQADYLGGFLAYSAGYGTFDKGSEIIKALYKAYKLPDILKKYPSLSDRQTLSVRTAEKLKQLIQVFDMANLLTAIGHYSEAYQYYRYVLIEYQSREIYNNLGVTALLDALQYFNSTELKFRYPIQLDLQSSARDGSLSIQKRLELLRQALLHFDAAISLDPNYPSPYLNKACAYALLGDLERAQFYGNVEARMISMKMNDTITLHNVDVLMGILEATKGNKDEAKKFFQAASSAGSALAEINLKLLNNKDLGNEKLALSVKKENIDNQNLKSIINDVEFKNTKSYGINEMIRFNFIESQNPFPNSFILQTDNSGASTQLYFQCTNPDYIGSTARKIKLGSNLSEIVAAYGNPMTTIETTKGQILVYKSQHLIFILNNNKLEKWVLYDEG
ncbi:MAG: tetratricopeptide repeat protein [Saprospiraceae bacterium]